MRRRFLYLGLAVLLAGASPALAQSDERDTLLGVDAVGPLFGVYSGTFQQLLRNDLGIFVRGGYFDPKWGVLYRDLVPEGGTYWSADAEIGFNYYPQDSAPSAFFAGLGVSPGYLFLRDGGNEAARFRIGVVTQVGYQFVWGPVAVGPRASMGYQWVLAELGDRPEMDAEIPNEIGIRGTVSGFWLGAGLDLSIAF